MPNQKGLGKGCEHLKTLATIRIKHPHQKQLTRIGFFQKVSSHNPNFTTCWKYFLAMPLHGGKKQRTEYSQHGLSSCHLRKNEGFNVSWALD
jgi:hypothetical protein